jgi:hypothetical protein
MAASLMIRTGLRKALAKSNRTQPEARLWGSATGRPRSTNPGYPIAMPSNFQSRVILRTPDTNRAGVMRGPEANARLSTCPEASSFTWVPPMSMTRMFMGFRHGGGTPR